MTKRHTDDGCCYCNLDDDDDDDDVIATAVLIRVIFVMIWMVLVVVVTIDSTSGDATNHHRRISTTTTTTTTNTVLAWTLPNSISMIPSSMTTTTIRTSKRIFSPLYSTTISTHSISTNPNHNNNHNHNTSFISSSLSSSSSSSSSSYCCTLCSQTFPSRNALFRHVRNHHHYYQYSTTTNNDDANGNLMNSTSHYHHHISIQLAVWMGYTSDMTPIQAAQTIQDAMTSYSNSTTTTTTTTNTTSSSLLPIPNQIEEKEAKEEDDNNDPIIRNDYHNNISIITATQVSMTKSRPTCWNQEYNCASAEDILVLKCSILTTTTSSIPSQRTLSQQQLPFSLSSMTRHIQEYLQNHQQTPPPPPSHHHLRLHGIRILNSNNNSNNNTPSYQSHSFHAEQSCTQHIYHVLIPIHYLPRSSQSELRHWYHTSYVPSSSSSNNNKSDKKKQKKELQSSTQNNNTNNITTTTSSSFFSTTPPNMPTIITQLKSIFRSMESRELRPTSSSSSSSSRNSPDPTNYDYDDETEKQEGKDPSSIPTTTTPTLLDNDDDDQHDKVHPKTVTQQQQSRPTSTSRHSHGRSRTTTVPSTTTTTTAKGRFGALAYRIPQYWHNYANPILRLSPNNYEPVYRVIDRARIIDFITVNSGISDSSTTTTSDPNNSVKNPSNDDDDDDDIYIVCCIIGDQLLQQQVRRMVATAMAMVHGLLPSNYLEYSLDPNHIIETPLFPSHYVYRSHSRFHWHEQYNQGRRIFDYNEYQNNNNNKKNKDNHREDDPNLYITATEDPTKWMQRTILTNHAAIGSETTFSQQQQHHHYDDEWLTDLRNVVTPRIRQQMLLQTWQSDPSRIPINLPLPSPPPEYVRVLTLLRAMVSHQLWPKTSMARSNVIQMVETTTSIASTSTTNTIDNTADSTTNSSSGSFTVVNTNLIIAKNDSSIILPKANQLFPELAKAVFELEDYIIHNNEDLARASLQNEFESNTIETMYPYTQGSPIRRLPSTHCAINCNAQFKPHVDSGRGLGQSLSMIVGLGDYHGGNIIIEQTGYPIRYCPIEFDGWKLRHWTQPFIGSDRFTLVWFTPA